MKGLIAITASCMIAFASCKSNSLIIKNLEQTEVEINKSFTEPVTDSTFEFAIDSASLQNNMLFVQVIYTGEKSDIQFKLIWNGILLKTDPPKAIVFLKPEYSSIKGEKPVIHKLYFDMSTMLPMESYESVIILLKDYNRNL